MPRFRKKPVEIEARQLLGSVDGNTGRRIADWCGGSVGGTFLKPHVLISTLEGVMRADAGDFIICGVDGEFYPCKPDIFARTYDEVA
ncbi:hypothetical protein J7I94_19015 [Streptomyces sp. ISL-12]|uniref:hypothetical protein n=1 Tax=Streptomyces sp. ISL-12 TaxID=2819177 RepID=UPI001BEC5673|nr:hypothetical protein [Streptomyces sp. ISL-12]MBT2412625.1 hypothetical protein [Streptomyces sp. ISL-12]